jgi:hypothetical protein
VPKDVIEIDENEMLSLRARLSDGPVDLSLEQAVRLTLAWIRQETPAAVVRFGEGEGRLLVADEEDALSMKVATGKLRRQTGLEFSARDVLKVKSIVLNAFDHADIVGIREDRDVNPEMRMWVERIEQVFETRLANGRKPVYVSQHRIHAALTKSLHTLLDGQRQISVVSCRDVGPILQAKYGVEDVHVYQVPSQYIMRRVDGEYEAALHGIPIWPDFYRRLHADLSARRRGEVFLVGAGLFGKDLCIRIKQLGGIALDLGYQLDRMAGKTTRGRNKPEPYRP